MIKISEELITKNKPINPPKSTRKTPKNRKAMKNPVIKLNGLISMIDDLWILGTFRGSNSNTVLMYQAFLCCRIMPDLKYEMKINNKLDFYDE